MTYAGMEVALRLYNAAYLGSVRKWFSISGYHTAVGPCVHPVVRILSTMVTFAKLYTNNAGPRRGRTSSVYRAGLCQTTHASMFQAQWVRAHAGGISQACTVLLLHVVAVHRPPKEYLFWRPCVLDRQSMEARRPMYLCARNSCIQFLVSETTTVAGRRNARHGLGIMVTVSH